MAKLLLASLLAFLSIAGANAEGLLSQAVGSWVYTSDSGSTIVWLNIAPQGRYSSTLRASFGSGQNTDGQAEVADGTLLLRPTSGARPMKVTKITDRTLTAIVPIGAQEYTLTFKRQ